MPENNVLVSLPREQQQGVRGAGPAQRQPGVRGAVVEERTAHWRQVRLADGYSPGAGTGVAVGALVGPVIGILAGPLGMLLGWSTGMLVVAYVATNSPMPTTGPHS